VLGDHPVWCAIGAGVVGAIVVAALAVSGTLSSSSAPRPSSPGAVPPSAAAFLSAWRAHLTASWSVDEVVERTTTSGSTVRFQVHEAQDPPNSVSIGNGTVAARRGATEVACGPGTGGSTYACRSAPAPLSWQRDVDQQIAGLAAEVSGPRPYFSVHSAGKGCWAFTLVVPPQNVPVVLGRGATFCLDLATGALRSSRVQRVGAVDQVTVVSGHAPATAADLALPPGASA